MLGSGLTLLGMIIKCFAGKGFYFLVMGQLIAAAGQSFLVNSPAKVSAAWFSPRGVRNAF